eukprot:3448291-Rhodomonas_salina.4
MFGTEIACMVARSVVLRYRISEECGTEMAYGSEVYGTEMVYHDMVARYAVLSSRIAGTHASDGTDQVPNGPSKGTTTSGPGLGFRYKWT